jgi:hypothetical protein
MSEVLEALNNKIKGLGAPLQEVVDSLPCLSKGSLTAAEAEQACEALTPHIGEGSYVLSLIRSKVTKVAKVKKTLKSVLSPKPKPPKEEEE